MSLQMEMKRVKNNMIRSAHEKGQSAYLVHRALKEKWICVIPAIMDFYDDLLPGQCSYSIHYREGFDNSFLDPRNYPQILAGLKRGADKAELNRMQWP